jgi:hypothetical protein
VSDSYEPRPIPTSDVDLPSDLDPLVELLAQHNHDHWAKRRLAEGWTYGTERRDELRTHPDLVHYDELTEEEREYDRTSVLETLRAIVALGYEIRPRSS